MAACVAFPLVDPLPSTDSAASDSPALFARFSGTMRSSDSPQTCVAAVRHFACAVRPRSRTSEGGTCGVSRFPCCEFPRMLRVFDSAAPWGGLPYRRTACGLPHDIIRSARGRNAFGAQRLACVYPCPGYTRDVTIASVGLGAKASG